MKPSELLKLPVKARREFMQQQVEMGDLRAKVEGLEDKLRPDGEWSKVATDSCGKPTFVAADAPS